MRLTNDGKVGIGTSAPVATLDVAGSISATAAGAFSGATGFFVSTQQGGTALEGVANLGASAWGVLGTSASGYGVVGTTNAGTGAGGWFVNNGGGTAIRAHVNGSETMNVDATGVHGGPGMTPTPIAHGFFSSSGARVSGSSNINCSWDGGNGRYACSIAGESYYYSPYTAIVTPGSGPYVVGTGSGNRQLFIAFWNLSGTTVAPETGFAVVVFKQ